MHLKLCIIIFETLWGKLQNLLGIKLTSGETLLTLPAVDKDIYIFSCHRCWLWNYLNQRTFVTLVIGLLIQLNAIAKKRSWKRMVLLQFSDEMMDSCYSVTTLGPLGRCMDVKQGWYYKVWQPIMNPREMLLKLLEANLEIYLERCWTTDVTLLSLWAVDNDIFAYFFMSQVWTMKLTESMNICYVGAWFLVRLQKPSWETMVSCKCLFCDWTAVRE